MPVAVPVYVLVDSEDRFLGVRPNYLGETLVRQSGLHGDWNLKTASALGRKFDVIIAMNVLGHVKHPLSFLQAIKKCLNPGGMVFIQVSQAKMQINYEFDTVYHEYFSFFTTKSFSTLSRRTVLNLISARHVPIHGTSFLWMLMQETDRGNDSVKTMVAKEELAGYYNVSTYDKFQDMVNERVKKIRSIINVQKQQGGTVLGYGAAAKGNTFLNYGKLKLDFIVDDNPLKWDLFTLGMNIRIVSPEILKSIKGDCLIVVLSWNFFDEVRQRVAKIRPGFNDTFVRYYPDFEVK